MSIGFAYRESFDDEMKLEAFRRFQEFLESKLREGSSFFVARMSGIEMGEIGRFYDHRDFSMVRTRLIQKHSGINVFHESSWVDYVNLTHLALSQCDRLAIWDGECYSQCQSMYDYCQKVFGDKYTMPAHCLEPYYFFTDSTYRLPDIWGDRKILVVASHTVSMTHQLRCLDAVFHPYGIFGRTDKIQLYRTTQQLGDHCDGQDWKVHYDRMCVDISKLDFDVALIGCGGFSNVLAYFIYRTMGRSAIYVGGPIQLFFGILGQRWLMNDCVMNHVRRNVEHWIRPLQEDYPEGYNLVDDSSYWMR